MNKNLPATLRRGAAFLEDMRRKEHPEILWTPWYVSAMQEAAEELERLAAADIDRVKNVPLTLEELKQMVDEPVWAVYNGTGRWCLVNEGLLSITGTYGEDGGLIAYRHKPEGGAGDV